MDGIQERQDAPQLILILGGARSGKSTFAERLAQQSGHSVAYIATAQAIDEEMQQRIRHHQSSRPKAWRTIEEPLNLVQAVGEGAHIAEVLLLDCITTWLGNWLFAQGESELDEAMVRSLHLYDLVIAEIEELLESIAALPGTKTVLLVSNEVGMGIVPAYPLGRVYRDLLGIVNQRLAASAQRVYLLVAGLAVDLKKLQEEIRI